MDKKAIQGTTKALVGCSALFIPKDSPVGRFVQANWASVFSKFEDSQTWHLWDANGKFYVVGLGIARYLRDFLKGESWARSVIDDFTKVQKFAKKFYKYLTFENKCRKVEPIEPKRNYQLREYQKKALELALSKPAPLIVIPTGGGKTIIEASVAYSFAVAYKDKAKVYVITPLKVLVEQLKTTFFEAFQETLPNVEFLTLQKFSKLLKERKVSQPAILIFDEVHTATNVLTEVYRNPKFRIVGFTATPFRKFVEVRKFKKQDVEILGIFGLPVFEVSREELIRSGYLVDLEVWVRRRNLSFKIDSEQDYRRKRTIVATSSEVVGEITKTIVSLIREGGKRNIVVISDLKKQIDLIRKNLAGLDFDYEVYVATSEGVFNLKGEKIVPKSEMKAFFKSLEKKTGWILLATTVLETGVDIRNIDVVINGWSGATLTQILQRIGRAVRPFPTKKKAIFIDFFWNDNGGLLAGMSKARLGIYRRAGLRIIPIGGGRKSGLRRRQGKFSKFLKLKFEIDL